MNGERIYTDTEIIEDAVNTIGRMQVPVGLVEEIGYDLRRVLNNLAALLDAKRKESEKPPETPAVSIDDIDVEVEVVGDGETAGEKE